MKAFYFFMFCSILFGCKKKECKQEILPDIIVQPTYKPYFSNYLIVSVKGTQKDTVLGFGALIQKFYNEVAETSEVFKTVSYNSYNSNIDVSSNFLNLANNSSWLLTSPIVGNISNVDNRLNPLCNDAGNLGLNTISLSLGVNLNLTSISNADYLNVYIFAPYKGVDKIVYYNLRGLNSINKTIITELSSFDNNDDVVVYLSFGKWKIETINGYETTIEKRTIYKYMSKIVL